MIIICLTIIIIVLVVEGDGDQDVLGLCDGGGRGELAHA